MLTRTAMFTREALDELVRADFQPKPLISVYLRAMPPEAGAASYASRLRALLRDAPAKTPDGVDISPAAVERLVTDIDEMARDLPRGLAAFATADGRQHRRYRFAIPVADRVTVGEGPFVTPLVKLLDERQRYAVALVDRRSARVFLVHLGEVEEYTELFDPNVRGQFKGGGWRAWEESRRARRIDNQVKAHLEQVAEELEDLLADVYVGRLVLAGPIEARTRFESLLPTSLRGRIVGAATSLPMIATTAEVLAATRPLVETAERAREDENLDELVTRASKGGGAAIGIDDVLNHLGRGNVHKLFVERNLAVAGATCERCGALVANAPRPACPHCGGRLRADPHLVDTAVRRGLRTGALVEVVAWSGRLARAGSMGAWLRSSG